jgi:hypothetical protein
MGAPNTGWLRDADIFDNFNEGVSEAAVVLLLAYRKLQVEYRTC